MLRRLGVKLKSRSGESIGETLIALLISALALMMLAGAIGSAAKIVTRNKDAMEEYYVGISGASSQQKTNYEEWKQKMAEELL